MKKQPIHISKPEEIIASLVRRSFLTLILVFFLASCSSSGDDTTDQDIANALLAFFSVGATSDSDGVAIAEFSLPAGTNKFGIVSSSSAPLLATRAVANENGTVHLSPDGEIVTLATFLAPGESTVNIPSRDFDPAVSGGEYAVAALLARASGGSFLAVPGTSATFTVLAKGDSDLRNGTLPVNIFYVGPLVGDEPTRSIVNDGLSEMRNIYGSQAGLTLSVNEFNIDGPAAISDPNSGSSVYLSGSSAAPSPAVNIFIGLDINEDGVLGISGGIPGAPIPTAKSAVVVSMLSHAGPDGNFSTAEILILGETMAHEAGHFMGLFHPAESSFDEFDPLTDTANCRSNTECSSAGLTNNLLYFTALSDASGTPVRQNQLTSQQRGVLNLYVAVD